MYLLRFGAFKKTNAQRSCLFATRQRGYLCNDLYFDEYNKFNKWNSGRELLRLLNVVTGVTVWIFYVFVHITRILWVLAPFIFQNT